MRRLAFATAPLIALAQCAPQCTPGPPPDSTSTTSTTTSSSTSSTTTITPTTTSSTTSPTSSTTAPPPVTDWTFTEVGTFGRPLVMTPDGRYVVWVRNGGDSYRLDLETEETAYLAVGNTLSPDGSTTFGFDSVSGLTRATVGAVDVTAIPGPAGRWFDFGVTGVAADGDVALDLSRTGPTASRPIPADLVAFRFDASTSVWSRADVGFASPPASTSGLRLSADGSVGVVDVVGGPGSCGTCRTVWDVSGPTPTLISATATGEASASGSSTVYDLSTDGRFVLYRSTSVDLAGGIGDPAGRLYVHDRQRLTTTLLDVELAAGYNLPASISDDGRSVALGVDADLAAPDGSLYRTQTPAIHDVTSGTTRLLLRDQTTDSTLFFMGRIEISADGRRVTFGVGAVQTIRADAA